MTEKQKRHSKNYSLPLNNCCRALTMMAPWKYNKELTRTGLFVFNNMLNNIWSV